MTPYRGGPSGNGTNRPTKVKPKRTARAVLRHVSKPTPKSTPEPTPAPARGQARPPQQVVRQHAQHKAAKPAQRVLRAKQKRAEHDAPKAARGAQRTINRVAEREVQKARARSVVAHRAREPLPSSYSGKTANDVVRAKVKHRAEHLDLPSLGQTIRSLDAQEVYRTRKNGSLELIGWRGRDGKVHLIHDGDPRGQAYNEASAGTPFAKARAPAVKAVELAGRPYHAEFGAIDAAIKGKNVQHAAARGLEGKEHKSGSDVLKTLGVKNKVVRAVGGFGLDVVADPLTHGRARVATKAGESATRGIQVGVRAKVPFSRKLVAEKYTSGKTTAKIADKAKSTRVGRKVTQGNAKVRDALHETVAPDVTPSYRTRTEHAAVRRAERKARAQTNTGERKVARRVRALKKATPEDESQRIVDAIERGTTKNLPTKLEKVARSYKREHTRQFRVKQRRHLLDRPMKPHGPEDAQAYFPHVHTKTLKDAGASERVGRKAAVEKGRTIRKPLAQVNKEAPGTFIDQPEVAHGLKSIQNLRQQVRSDLWQTVAKTGRKLTPDSTLEAGEAVYRVTPHGLTPLTRADGAVDHAAVAKAAKVGDGVILNRKSVEHVLEPVNAQSGNVIGRGVDRATGFVKRIDTKYNPAFQPRNFMGDSMLGFQADTTARSMVQSAKAMRALHARNAAESSPESILGAEQKYAHAAKLLDRPVPGIKVKGKPVTYGQAIKWAEQEGAINTGQVASELRAQLGGTRVAKGLVRVPLKKGGVRVREKLKTGSGASTVSSINEYRENTPRFATFLEGLARGKSPSQAAEHSLKAHIDYGDLTAMEVKFNRRLIPFYTFFARNSRLQAKYLLEKPGKLATIAKVYDETSKAMGFESYQDYVETLPDQQQRGLPIPVKVDGKTYPVFLSPPQSDLNQLSADPETQLFNLANRISFFKAIPEVLANYSFFFQGEIQNADYPRVPAPGGVEHLPGPIRSALGVKQIIDKRSGKKVWGWYAKADYLSRFLPQSNFAVSVTKPTQDQRGLNGWVSLGSFLTGVRVAPDRTQDNRVNQFYKQRIDLQHKLHAAQQSLPKDHEGHYKKTHETRLLQKQINALDKQIGSLRIKRGDPRNQIPPNQLPKKKGNPFSDLSKGQGKNPFDDLDNNHGKNPFDELDK